jgi:hypothetical protein
MNKADIRALEAQLTELPHTQKKHFLSLLLLLIEYQAASFIDSLSDIIYCGYCTSPQIKSRVNPQVSNVIHAEILSVVRRLQVLLYLAFTKKISGSIISSVCSIAYLLKKQYTE